MDKDFSSSTKRVLFHFPKTQRKYDEWVEIGSSRISPLNTKRDSNKEKRAKQSGQAQARTIGSEAKGKVPVITGTKKKVATNKVHPTEEVSSGKPQLLKVSMEIAARSGLGAQGEEAVSNSIPLEKSSNDATSRAEDGTRAASDSVKGSSGASNWQIGQDAASFEPNASVTKNKSATIAVTGERTHQQIVSERSSSVSKSIGKDSTIHLPKKEKSLSTAAQTMSVAIPRKVSSQGSNETVIGTIPRKILPYSSSPRHSGGGVPNGMPRALQFSVGMKTSGSPDKSRALRNVGQFSAPQPFPYNRPTPTPYDAARLDMTNGTHRPLQFSVGMRPDSATAPRHDRWFGQSHIFPKDREDQMSRPATWQCHRFHPKFGSPPNKNQYGNWR